MPNPAAAAVAAVLSLATEDPKSQSKPKSNFAVGLAGRFFAATYSVSKGQREKISNRGWNRVSDYGALPVPPWGRLNLENVVFSVRASVRRAVVVAKSGTSTIARSCATNNLTLDRNFEDRAEIVGVR